MLDERYPQEAWMRVFTDGSATDAVKRGGAGVYIQHPSGEWQAEAIPTGLHCTNYRAEVEALIHAANTISSKVNPDTQVVFLTDALSVLQAVNNNKLPQLTTTLHNITCLKTVFDKRLELYPRNTRYISFILIDIAVGPLTLRDRGERTSG
ncbi:hypothetical protein V1264_020060 [Littorina saxatilis]|uniref:RNase H type-1 domain-containing protein n=2 Tax=Littorina saxatilis TaxID=31220 RepID=A0AAN9B9D1_9CAEN